MGLRVKAKAFLEEAVAFIRFFWKPIGIVIGTTFFIWLLIHTSSNNNLPGVGSNCEACKIRCKELGQYFNTETKFYNGRCWVKGWAPE